jgi:hypothetical protein
MNIRATVRRINYYIEHNCSFYK